MTICSLEPETNVTPTNETCLAWVSPQRLLDRWQPEMFHPIYIELDRIIGNSEEFVPLREFVHIHTAAHDRSVNRRWRADTLEIKRSYVVSQETSSGVLPDVTLPNEAILVPKRWTGEPTIQYWHDALFSGGGTASPHLWVLSAKDSESIAWLERELASELGLLQLQRAAIGAQFAFLPAESLLELRIRKRTLDERRALNNVLIPTLRSDVYSASYRALKRPIILTGETFEERLREFERFLSEDTLFNSADVFFVESATNNQASDLFVIRPIGRESRGSHPPADLVVQDAADIDIAWREWYWSDPDLNPYRVFNSAVGHEHCLPGHILLRTTARRLPFQDDDNALHFALPTFLSFASAFDSSPSGGLPEFTEAKFAVNWLEANEMMGLSREVEALCAKYKLAHTDVARLAKDEAFVTELSRWASAVYRPALVVRVVRDKRLAGAYLLFGDMQVSDCAAAHAWLDDMGMAFQEILSPPPRIVEDAARRESLRRLSWLMHQINSPIGKAKRALEDISIFLENHSDLASELVPDEDTAKRRMRTRKNADYSRFTLASRLAHALKQIEDVRRVAYQVKRLKRVQGDLTHSDFDLASMLRDRVNACLENLPAMEVTWEVPQAMSVLGNAESIRDAIDEVLHNACREMSEHNVCPPAMTIRAWSEGSLFHISIGDNGLPGDARLMDDPFEEDASTYARKGRGSGLGLAIVRETFAAHGGECSLTENFDETGERVSGVTFAASINVSRRRNH